MLVDTFTNHNQAIHVYGKQKLEELRLTIDYSFKK